MTSAAPAVIEVPPPARSSQRVAPAHDDAFEAHMETALEDEAAVERTPPASENADDRQVAAAAQPAAFAPIVLQFIAAPEETASTPAAAPAEAATDEIASAAANKDALIAPADIAGKLDRTSAAKKDALGETTQASPQIQDVDAAMMAPAPAMLASAQPTLQPLAQPSSQPTTQPTTPCVEATAVASAQPAHLVKAAQTTNAKSRPVEKPDAQAAATDAIATTAAPSPTGAKPQPRADARTVPTTSAAPKDAPAPSTVSADIQPSALTQAGALLPAPTQTLQQAALDASEAVRAAPAGAQVAREIIRRFDGGATRFELRLDPPELGRIEVRLDVTRDHRVTAVVAADSPHALAELMRHARDLEQTLQSAGLQLTENGLSFDLRQRDRGLEQTLDDARGSSGSAADDAVDDAAAPAARPIGYERWRGARVDMMV